jgi:hypothetical protein
MQNSMSIDVQPRLRTRGFKSLLLAALGVVAICGCLLHTGVLSAPITASSVASEYVPSALEQQTAEEIRDLLHKAQVIMQDPAKVKLLSQRIQQVFKDPEFKAKMKAQMEALRSDEAFYTWLKMMLTPEAQVTERRLGAAFGVQPTAFRGSPAQVSAPAMQSTSVLPRANLPVMAATKSNPQAFAQSLPGANQKGFWDPAGFCSADDVTEGKIRFYREVELKHCRVAMLAALGFPIAEQFHPLFGGDIDVPSFTAFQATPLETFWPIVVFALAIPEIYSVFTFIDPAENQAGAQVNWEIRSDHVAGDFGFDPLGLKPTDPAELIEMQNKELNNGRLAMLAIAGMVVQEAVTGGKLF